MPNIRDQIMQVIQRAEMDGMCPSCFAINQVVYYSVRNEIGCEECYECFTFDKYFPDFNKNLGKLCAKQNEISAIDLDKLLKNDFNSATFNHDLLPVVIRKTTQPVAKTTSVPHLTPTARFSVY